MNYGRRFVTLYMKWIKTIPMEKKCKKKKKKKVKKKIYFCFIDYTKAFDCVDHNKLWKILQEMGIPHHLT